MFPSSDESLVYTRKHSRIVVSAGRLDGPFLAVNPK